MLLIVLSTLCITSCSKEKKYQCDCVFTFNQPSQWVNPSPTTQTVYYGPSKIEAQKAFNTNNGNNGTSTGVSTISEK